MNQGHQKEKIQLLLCTLHHQRKVLFLLTQYTSLLDQNSPPVRRKQDTFLIKYDIMFPSQKNILKNLLKIPITILFPETINFIKFPEK